MKKRVFNLTMAMAIALVPLTAQAALIDSQSITGGNINYTVDAGAGFLSTGDFVTLYDAGASPINLAGDIANSKLFITTTNFTDTPALFTLPTDDPTITNLRFTYIGAGNLSDALLGSFSLADPSGLTRIVSEDGTYHTSAGPTGQAGGGGFDSAPVVSPTPEPSSLVLLGSGLAGLAGLVRRRLLA